MKASSATSGAIAASTPTAAGPCSASKCAVVEQANLVVREMGLQMRQILVAAAGIDDDEETVLAGGDDQVIDDAAGVIGQLGVAGAAGGEALDIGRDHAFDGGRRTRAGDRHLAHVRDVEEGGTLAGLAVLLEDAGRVLHRHRPAGEVDHAAAELAVQLIQRRRFERGHRSRPHGGVRDGTDSSRLDAPSVLDLRDSDASVSPSSSPSVGCPRTRSPEGQLARGPGA